MVHIRFTIRNSLHQVTQLKNKKITSYRSITSSNELEVYDSPDFFVLDPTMEHE
uniref:Uncharacterized protein n=1 Tax=Aegilops tauschii subsp. strangulata TaxID=200361 RepID=A0A453PRM2_AEGTS